MTNKREPLLQSVKKYIDIEKFHVNKVIILECLVLLEDLSGESRNINFLDPRKFMVLSLLTAKVPLRVEGPIRSTVIRNSIQKWLGYKRTENKLRKFSSFSRALFRELEIALNVEKFFSVVFFLPLDLIRSLKRSSFIVSDKEICQIDWKILNSFLSDDQLSDAYSQCQKSGLIKRHTSVKGKITYTTDRILFTPYLISINAYNTNDAFFRAHVIISMFRAAVNLPRIFGSYTIFSNLVPRVKIPDSPLFLVFDGRGSLAPGSIINNSNSSIYQYSSISFETNKLEEYVKWLKFIEEKPAIKTTKQFILKILSLYLDAVDSVEPSHAYLSMYQTIENALMFGEENERFDSQLMKKRIVALLNPDWLQDTLLNELVSIRNRFVHSGIFPSDEEKCFDNLKLITELVINKLIKLSSKYPKIKDLRTFIELNSLGSQSLEDKKKIIEDVLELRKK